MNSKKVKSRYSKRNYSRRYYGGEKNISISSMQQQFIKINTNQNDVFLPITKYITHPIIMTHGLGNKNPKKQSHYIDEWINDVLIPGAKLNNSSYFAYTWRGHGNSTGWESSLESDPTQFEWDRLSNDMLAIADNENIVEFIAAGSSVGSATALYSAMKQPNRIKALVLLRPPKGWNRNPTKKLENERECERKNPNLPNCKVLSGTAYSDYPPKDSESFSKIACPVLILTIKGNAAHPVDTARELNRLIKTSEIHVAENEIDAKRHFLKLFLPFWQRYQFRRISKI
jgi:pimeloyl-ACP methyl ester carboxylesterase